VHEQPLRSDDHGRLRWERFLTRIDSTAVVDEATRAASEWEDDQRVPSWPMLRSLLSGAPPPPAWGLVRSLELSRDIIDDALFARWIEAGVLDEITTLRFKSRMLTTASLVRACEALPRLRRVELRHLAPPRDTRGRHSGRVTQWTLFGCDAIGVSTLLDSELSAAMDSLSIVMPQPGGEEWWTSERLGQLREFRLVNSALAASALTRLVELLPTGLESLAVTGHERADDLAPVLAAALPSLTRLDLSRNGLGDRALKGAAVIRTGRLERLDLSHNKIGNPTFTAAAEALASVKVLDASATRIGERSLEVLPTSTLVAIALSDTDVAGPALSMLTRCGSELETLVLQRAHVDQEFIEALGTRIALPRLGYLDLSYNELDGDAFVHLATRADLPRLETLKLTGCPLGVSVVAEPPKLERLRELWAEDTHFHVPEPAVLFDAERLPRVEVMRLGGHELGPETAATIADYARHARVLDIGMESSTHWEDDEFRALLPALAPTLLRADLGGNTPAQTAIVDALATQSWPRLLHLDIRDLSLTPDDVCAVVSNRSFENLSSLWLSCPTPEHVHALASSPLLAQLDELMIYGISADDGEPIIIGAPHYKATLEVLFV
jgi:hypothetical protein